MRTSDVLRVLFVGVGLGMMPAVAFDGQRSPSKELSPIEAFRSGAEALQAGENAKALTALQYAAEKGHAAAQWKLGRMYASGEGVARDDLKAFRYFSSVANLHSEDSPFTPEARFVSSAFVSLGHYYLEGIKNSAIRPNVARAHEMFRYAASYFGDADAQYVLGRLYLEGRGVGKDAKQAARWLRLAANKGQHQAQALLGSLFISGQVPRQAARGLMWLMLARDAAGPDEAWIAERYNDAVKQASDDEREMALFYLRGWLNNRRELSESVFGSRAR
jgi:TPR repeat protein